MSFGSKKTTTSSRSQSDPWDETIPFLQDFLKTMGNSSVAQIGPTGEQLSSYETLKANSKAGNPWSPQIGELAGDQFNAADRTGTVAQGYSDLQRRLRDTADGKNLDLANNTYLQGMLTQVGDDVMNRVNAGFAAAGRDLSGANQSAVAKGVTAAQLPLLLDFFNKEQARTDAAARDLNTSAGNSASQMAALDQVRNAIRSAGIGTANEAMNARDAGANTILNLEQQMKDLKWQDLAQIANLLFPAAGLGQQSSGKSTSKSSGFSIGIGDIGKGAAALSTLFCDRRLKTDVVQIGAMADGTPLYRFRYHGDDEVRIGPMADEVDPDAVTTVGGFLAIDIFAATDRAARIIADRKGASHGAA